MLMKTDESSPKWKRGDDRTRVMGLWYGRRERREKNDGRAESENRTIEQHLPFLPFCSVIVFEARTLNNGRSITSTLWMVGNCITSNPHFFSYTT
jgi:hypothetical protein